jgi:hypothetical protein
MSSVRRYVLTALAAGVLVPAFAASQAQAQCQGGGRSSMSGARQQGGASLRGSRQTNNLQGSPGQTTGLQSNLVLQQNSLQAATQQQAALQAALAQATARLNAADENGATPAQLSQLSAVQQQLAAALVVAQQQALLQQQMAQGGAQLLANR